MHLDVRDQQLETITYILRLLDIKFIVMTNQKPTVLRYTHQKEKLIPT